MDELNKVQSQDEFLSALRQFTAARIGIGRTGASIPLKQALAFKLAHAHARDAVYSELDVEKLAEELKQFELPVLQLRSQASYREQYLQRPDLGRLLDDRSAQELANCANHPEIVIVIADGLSAAAVNRNAVGLLRILVPELQAAGLQIGPVCLVKQGRVAIADDIGIILNAKLSLMLIGERPGLSSADSLGAYLTYSPMKGLTDESRNCISNIRLNGLSFRAASKKIFYLIHESFRRKLSGVGLKDNAGLLP